MAATLHTIFLSHHRTNSTVIIQNSPELFPVTFLWLSPLSRFRLEHWVLSEQQIELLYFQQKELDI